MGRNSLADRLRMLESRSTEHQYVRRISDVQLTEILAHYGPRDAADTPDLRHLSDAQLEAIILQADAECDGLVTKGD